MESDIVDEQAVKWFVRLRADNVNKDDWVAFAQWLEQADEQRKAFSEICDMWGDTTLLKSLTLHAKTHDIVPKRQKKRYIISRVPLALLV